jgi:hypothetical protein
MHIRKYRSEDLEMLQNWFSEWNWSGFDPSMIPQNAFIAEINGYAVGFSCFASTDCSIALMGYTVVTKQFKGDSKAVVDELLKSVTTTARDAGHKYLVYYTNTAFMVPRMRKAGLKLAHQKSKTWVLVGGLNGENTEFLED